MRGAPAEHGRALQVLADCIPVQAKSYRITEDEGLSTEFSEHEPQRGLLVGGGGEGCWIPESSPSD